MTDPEDFDLNDLRATARAATPRPDPAARAAHLRLAQENFARVQGSADAARLTSDRPRGGLLSGVLNMLNHLTTRGALTATTALVAVGFLGLTPMGRNLVNGDWRDRGGVEEPVVLAPPLDSSAAQAEPVTNDYGTAIAEAAPVDEVLRTDAEAAEFGADTLMAEEGRLAVDVVEPPAVVTQEPAIVAPAPAAEAVAGYADTAMAPQTLGRVAADGVIQQVPEADTETFATADENPLKVTAEEPVSTFSTDVDTASYAIIRQSLNMGALPPADAVRVEEMVNYFPYAYPTPGADEAPFRTTVTVMDTPWNSDTDLVHIALQGAMPAITDRPPLNLVFLIDTSGSMEDPNKLPLLKQSFLLMLDNLGPEDQVAIVAYAGSSGLVLPPTAASDRQAILTAMQNLAAGGGTNGQAGLQQAYATAQSMAADGEVSRVILATDGDFNVGVSSIEELTTFVEDQRETGVFLSVLGFGRGNLDDATMQALAQNGNGIAAYIDTLNEAQKVLVDQLTGALFAIASDVKVQVEWNPAAVAEYRLIGYETRALAREDFNNDAVDAGDIGAGLSVTAIYEVTPVGSPAVRNSPLRYGEDAAPVEPESELGFLRLRWKAPGAEDSQLIETPILSDAAPADPALLTEAQFAVAMAGFGQLLRDSDFVRGWGWDQAIALAADNRGDDPFGYRNEAVRLMRLAQSLSAQ